MHAQTPDTATAAPALSQYQSECWVFLGRLLAPFLPGEEAAPEAATPVREIIPSLAVPPVVEHPADPHVAEPTPSSLTVEPAPLSDELPHLAWLDELPAFAPAPIALEPARNLEEWLPTAAAIPAPPPLQPIASLCQPAAEFFASLAWGPVGGSAPVAVPTGGDDAGKLLPISAADFFGHRIAWGGETSEPAAPDDPADLLGSRMMTAATFSAVHLSRKLAGRIDASDPVTARDFFTNLGWQAAA